MDYKIIEGESKPSGTYLAVCNITVFTVVCSE